MNMSSKEAWHNTTKLIVSIVLNKQGILCTMFFQPILHSKRENKPLKVVLKIAMCKPVYANMQFHIQVFKQQLHILAHVILLTSINYWHVQNLSMAIFTSIDKFVYANNLQLSTTLSTSLSKILSLTK